MQYVVSSAALAVLRKRPLSSRGICDVPITANRERVISETVLPFGA
jgi:hypothetical protein